MGAFDSIKKCVRINEEKKNDVKQKYPSGNRNQQNLQNRRCPVNDIHRTEIRRPDADDEKTTMIWTPKNHR